jgi:hypothetical protein
MPPAVPVTLILAVGFAGRLSAQTLETLDLSTAAAHDTVTLKPGRYQFRIVSKAPKYEYVIAISEGVESIKPISTRFASDTGCTALRVAAGPINTASTETQIAALVRRTRSAIRELTGTPNCAGMIRDAENLLTRTEHIVDRVYNLAAGDFVVVDVARIEDGAATRRWVRRYTTGAPGEWRATYGYAFPATWRVSRGKFVRDGARYFAREVPDTGTVYVIAEERRTRQFDAVPTVMFAYSPANERGFTWNRLTAGLGIDLTDPILFIGTGWTYEANLRVAIGASFREELVPVGRYTPGDTVRTNLSTEQLHEDAFRVRPFLAVSLRFDKNPFKKEGESDKSEEKPSEESTRDEKPAAEPPKGEEPAGEPAKPSGEPLPNTGAVQALRTSA